MSLTALRKELKTLANPAKAKILARFFKTGKGEYGEGDVFLGLTVPQSRKLAQKHKDLSFGEITELLESEIHEQRLIALLILVYNYQRGGGKAKKNVYQFYLDHTKCINNWDLVDLSADKIVGAYLLDRPRKVLYKLVKSQNIWERRIAMIATFQFIKEKFQYIDTLELADILMADKHDLIHKAVGWMLREVGKRVAKEVLVDFLQPRYKKMPRSMLRYAIEHFPEKTRGAYLEGSI